MTDHKIDQHELNGELIKKLQPYYDPGTAPLVVKCFNKVQDVLFGGFHAKINTETFQQKSPEHYSHGQQVRRTIYALKKIKEFNHHFFNEDDLKIINPLPLGFLPYGLKLGYCAFDAFLMTYLWRTWSFNQRSLIFVGAVVAFQYATLHMPNFFNEMIQYPRRYSLANKYIDAYGYEFFHNVLNPKYDTESLKHLHNKLNP